MGIAVTDKHLREAADDILSLPKRSLTLVERQPSQVEILDELFESQTEPTEPEPLPASKLRQAEVIAASFDASALNGLPSVEAPVHEEEAKPPICVEEHEEEYEEAASMASGEEEYEPPVDIDERGYVHQPEIRQSEIRPPRADGYVVGLRLLRVSPIWLLLVSVSFFIVIFVLSWMSQPEGHAEVAEREPSRSNHATNTAAVSVETPAAETAGEDANGETEAPENVSAPEKVETPATSKEKTAEKSPSPARAKDEAAPEVGASGKGSSASSAGDFTVQVASFENESDANERVSKLRAAGFEARTVAVEIPRRGTWYRVHVGSFGGREEAARTIGKLRSVGVATDAFVTDAQPR